jgi:hypothetical protein
LEPSLQVFIAGIVVGFFSFAYTMGPALPQVLHNHDSIKIGKHTINRRPAGDWSFASPSSAADRAHHR